MAKQPKPKGIPKRFWCLTGNHACYRTELAVIHHGNSMGICYGCIKQRGGLPRYWLTEVIER